MRDLNLLGLRQAISSRITTFANKLLNDGSNSFLGVKGTLPSSPSAVVSGSFFNFTSAGSSAQSQIGLRVDLAAGYTGTNATNAITARCLTNSTATSPYSFGSNAAVAGTSIGDGSSSGNYFGGWFRANTGGTSGVAYGVFGHAIESGNINIGGTFTGSNGTTTSIGSISRVGNATSLTLVTAGCIISNDVIVAPILICKDNDTAVFTIDDGGDIKLLRTITTVGTTGNQTINKPSGTVNIAAGGTSVVVTNSLVTTSSIIHLMLRTNDDTARVLNYVPAAGSFTINIVSATAEVSIGFLVTN